MLENIKGFCLIHCAAFVSSGLNGNAFNCHKDTKALRNTKFSLKLT